MSGVMQEKNGFEIGRGAHEGEFASLHGII